MFTPPRLLGHLYWVAPRRITGTGPVQLPGQAGRWYWGGISLRGSQREFNRGYFANPYQGIPPGCFFMGLSLSKARLKVERTYNIRGGPPVPLRVFRKQS